ncbi:unnamed protein product [Mytilus coruscus]|uniref:Peptidase S1 domain-containing protein n=1 Tax=Mytilus coruscus TaxID=42192 RepID=A0A6J8AA86_MYTCO|nr:unnamed protein product [Mytilus coruscus]
MALVIEPNPEFYTSILLTQKTLKACPVYQSRRAHIGEINHVTQKPRILLFKHGNRLSSDVKHCLFGYSTDIGYQKLTQKIVENRKQWACPFATVVLLRASGEHGSCRLSRYDFDVLEEVKKNFKDFKDITFVIKDTRHSVKYNSEDLNHLSEEIQFTLCGTNHSNNVYFSTFLFNDNQVSVRIGLRMHKSIQKDLFNIQKCFQNLVNEINNLYIMFNKARSKITKSLNEMILKGFQCHSLDPRKRKKYIERFGVKIEHFIRMGQGKQFNSLFTAVEVKRLTKKHISSIVYAKLKHGKKGINTKQTKLRARNRQSTVYTASSTNSFKTTCKVNLSTIEAEKAAKMIYTDLNNKAQEYQKKVGIFSSHLEDECANSTLHGVSIHELKILAYRHEKVSGFGYIDGKVCIYIKGSTEDDKKEVLTFFKRYVNTKEYDFKIEFSKKREITYFAKLENGSRINKFKTAGTGPKGYGTLGMFLEDNNGTYFFTTCAHVIEEHAEAYFPDDNTKIGENVFVCHPNTNNCIKHAQKMDLSLIRVCPDFDVECKLGLKSVHGNFIKGAIFKGDISEIFGRRLYKWGATEPYLQTGKCTGIEEDEFIHIQINTDNFAKPGDSGAIICAGRDDDTALAAFVLVGEEMSERKDEKTTYVVYKVADALEIVEHMTKAKKPCLCTKL